MTRDELRSAHLLFGEELALGAVDAVAVQRAPEVREAVRSLAVPSPLSRRLQQRLVRRGELGAEEHCIAPMADARRAVLGDAAGGPPRFLLRVDGFPHHSVEETPRTHGTDAFTRVHAILRAAEVPYLVAVLPRVPTAATEPDAGAWRAHDPSEAALLQELRRDVDVSFAVHGLDHRSTDSRRPSELAGRKPAALRERLDTADAVLRGAGLAGDVFVAPWDRFDASQYAELAARYDVVTGGPRTIERLGFHRTPLWRGGAVFLPTLPGLSGRAGELLPAVERIVAARPALWIPLTLEWGAADDAELRRLAATLRGTARAWDEFLSGVRASRAAA